MSNLELFFTFGIGLPVGAARYRDCDVGFYTELVELRSGRTLSELSAA